MIKIGSLCPVGGDPGLNKWPFNLRSPTGRRKDEKRNEVKALNRKWNCARQLAIIGDKSRFRGVSKTKVVFAS